MSNFLTRSSSFIHYLPSEMQSVYELDQDSFFYQAFKANENTACEVVKTQYLQTMKVGNLNPNYYGGLTVLDSYYCYRASETLKSLLCKIDKEADKVMYGVTAGIISGYDDYNSTFLKDWHIREPDSVTPTETMRDYAEHEHNTMCYEDPIYTLVAYIPCYYLWPWFSEKIMSDTNYAPGVYGDWFSGNYYGPDSYKSALKIGNLIDGWQKAGKPFDEAKGFEVYRKSMNYELEVFTEAYTGDKKR